MLSSVVYVGVIVMIGVGVLVGVVVGGGGIVMFGLVIEGGKGGFFILLVVIVGGGLYYVEQYWFGFDQYCFVVVVYLGYQGVFIGVGEVYGGIFQWCVVIEDYQVVFVFQ